MQAYIIRRLILIIPTLLLVTLIVFFLVRFIPGNVIDMMVAEMATEVSATELKLTAEAIKARLGLDVPVHIQYGRWLGAVPREDGSFSGVLEGNLGESLWTGAPITEEIVRRFPISIELGIIALSLGAAIAIPLGTYSAIRQDTPGDYMGRTVAILMMSIPSFWVGTMVIVYPAIWWNWMPPLEYVAIATNPIANLQQIILPAFIMGMLGAGSEMRMMRTTMLDVLRQDYIRTAWAKGLTERMVIVRHALKNALIPVVTMIGNRVPFVVAGTVVMETIFNLPGMGRYLIEALNKRDYPVVSAINFTLAIIVLFTNLVVDLTYAWLDPRVHYK